MFKKVWIPLFCKIENNAFFQMMSQLGQGKMEGKPDFDDLDMEDENDRPDSDDDDMPDLE